MTEDFTYSRSNVRSWLLRSVGDLVVLAAAAILVGGLLVDAEALFGPLSIDRSAAAVPTLHSTGSNAVMTAVTRVGEEVVLALAFLGLTWWAGRTRGVVWGRFFAIVAVGALALDNIVKPFVGRARPTFEQLVPGTGSSFPSGHVIGVTALLLALAYFFGDERSLPIRSVIWTVAAAGIVAIGTSRIYLGVHWPSDTLAGMWLGALWAWRCRNLLVPNRSSVELVDLSSSVEEVWR
jgi:undecaprenyl-diphosphatase